MLDGGDDLARISPVANDDDSADGFLAILIKNAAAEFGTELHAGDVTDRHWRAVVGAERDVLNVLQAADQSDATHHVLRVADLHDLGADVVVASLDGGNNFLERDVVGAELHRIEVDLVLLHEAADACDLGNSGD